MTRHACLALLTCCLLLNVGCTYPIASRSMPVTPPSIDLESHQYRVHWRRVTGEDFVEVYFLFSNRLAPDNQTAIAKALEQAPGAVGLADVSIQHESWYVPLIYGRETIQVTGNPIYPIGGPRPDRQPTP